MSNKGSTNSTFANGKRKNAVKKPYDERKGVMLTKVNVDAIAALIIKGMPKNRACDMVGIHRTTLHLWEKEYDQMGDRMPSTPREKLLNYAVKTIRGARAMLLQRIVDNIQEKGSEDWRAWAFMAERMFPADLAENKQISVDLRSAPATEALEKVNTLGLTEEGLDIPSVPPVPSSSPRKRGGK